MKIIGRDNEKSVLKQCVESSVPEFLVVYGRCGFSQIRDLLHMHFGLADIGTFSRLRVRPSYVTIALLLTGRSRRYFITSSACIVPTTPGVGPITPNGFFGLFSFIPSGNRQRRHGPFPGVTVRSWP